MGTITSLDAVNRVNTIKTDDDKKFCESVDTGSGMKLVSKQGELDLMSLLRQAFGKDDHSGRKGRKGK